MTLKQSGSFMIAMFSLLLLTHDRQIAVARLKMFRHREPFVRLVVLKARSPDSKETPSRVDRRISTAVNLLLPRGLTAGVDMSCQSVESGGHEHGARSGDLEAHQTPYRRLPGTGRNTCKTDFNNPRRFTSLALTTQVSSPARLEEEYAALRHMIIRSAA